MTGNDREEAERMQFTEQEMGGNVRKICEDETCTVFRVRG